MLTAEQLKSELEAIVLPLLVNAGNAFALQHTVALPIVQGNSPPNLSYMFPVCAHLFGSLFLFPVFL